MLSNRQLKILYVPCRVCVDNLGYVEDAPKFASERGLKRHLKDVHNVMENKRVRFTL
jgi:hypothetical protein